MKIAWLVRPHIGGTFSVFRQLRDGLAGGGLEFRWLASGPVEALGDPTWRDELLRGDVVDPGGDLDPVSRLAALARLIESRGYDAVVFNVLGDPVETALARHLPVSILRAMIVHNITPGTYAAARSIRDHVHATACVSPRCRDDLVARHGFDPARTRLILNAVDVDFIARRTNGRPPHSGLRLLFLGRLEDASKGIFWLPKIMRRLGPEVSLTVVGTGPDEERLARACAPEGARIRMLGAMPPDQTPTLLARHDVLLMPSRFEGAPMSLIETMAAGCVPVASRIAGVTDALIEHGRSGLTFPVGAWREAARLISELERNPSQLSRLSHQARERARASCRIEDMAFAYAQLFDSLRHNTPTIAVPTPISHASFVSRVPLRSRAPEPLKNALRLLRERMRAGR